MGLAKASIRNLNTHQSIEVQFNPEEYSLDSANTFKTDEPKERPEVGFTGTKLRTLQLDLLVDTSQSQADVNTSVQLILDLLEKDPTTKAPPILLFSWGSFHFPCVIESVGQRYTQFRPDGSPVRAYLKLTMLESAGTGPAPSPDGPPAPPAVHTVRDGENLSQIAARVTGDPRNWREIAGANKLDNPRKLPIQKNLKLPNSNPRGSQVRP
jgi:hypothetical protein